LKEKKFEFKLNVLSENEFLLVKTKEENFVSFDNFLDENTFQIEEILCGLYLRK